MPSTSTLALIVVLLLDSVASVFQGSSTPHSDPPVFTIKAFSDQNCNSANALFTYTIKHLYTDSNCMEVNIGASRPVHWQAPDCHKGEGSLIVYPGQNTNCAGDPTERLDWSFAEIMDSDTSLGLSCASITSSNGFFNPLMATCALLRMNMSLAQACYTHARMDEACTTSDGATGAPHSLTLRQHLMLIVCW